ncbi:MAG: hypothetical protein ACOH15_04290 [Acetobacterium sp.]
MAKYLKFDKIIFNETHWPTNDREKGILIHSSVFPGVVKYVIKGDSLIILSGNHGVFCFDLDKGEVFINEIDEIVKCFRN